VLGGSERSAAREPLGFLAGLLLVLAFSVLPQTLNAEPLCHDADRVGPLIELDADGPLVATIAPQLGGQLVGLSYRDVAGAIELLYRGMDFCAQEGWGGKAPLLWPTTGRNANPLVPRGLGWRWNGQDYPMPIHGFARDLPWEVVAHERSAGADVLTVELRQTDQTRAHYPFEFVVRVEFRIDEAGLLMTHRIEADPDNDGPMPFSIGNHITFRQPLSPGGTMTVSTPAARRLILDASGRPTGAEDAQPLVQMPLSTFANEVAVPLAGYTGAPWLELMDSGGLTVRIEHAASAPADIDTVMFNLWGNGDRGFFSPEPWFGRQNSLVDDRGLVRLQPGEAFEWQLRVAVSR
jgi:galactose mutarotase-like enzyme